MARMASLMLAALLLASSCGGKSEGGGAGAGNGGAGSAAGSSGSGGSASGGCTYLGVDYGVGDHFRSQSGCNTCGCAAAGGVACTAIYCGCSPGEEPWRAYVAYSANECAGTDFACTGATAPFSNECGCGCEQDPNCPEWLDCMPGSGTCDTDHCPLSKRAT